MIVIQARVPVRNDRRSLALQHIKAFIQNTRREAGCLLCEAFVSVEDPDLLIISQRWEDGDQLDAHASGEGLDRLLEALPQFVAGEVTTSRFETVPSTEMVELDDDAESAPQGVTLH